MYVYNVLDINFFLFSRGMKFENVSILINAIEELIRRSGFYWIDNDGLISLQERVFRVNCMDCLDRTNVVQASIARNILLSIVSSNWKCPMILKPFNYLN